MNSWWPWVMMLGGVNLTRVRGHGWLWGLLAALGTLAFAEYFLVGTLGSVLAAIAVGEGLAYWTRIP